MALSPLKALYRHLCSLESSSLFFTLALTLSHLNALLIFKRSSCIVILILPSFSLPYSAALKRVSYPIYQGFYGYRNNVFGASIFLSKVHYLENIVIFQSFHLLMPSVTLSSRGVYITRSVVVSYLQNGWFPNPWTGCKAHAFLSFNVWQAPACLEKKSSVFFKNCIFLTPIWCTFSQGVIKPLVSSEKGRQKECSCPLVIMPHCKRKKDKQEGKMTCYFCLLYVVFYLSGRVGLCWYCEWQLFLLPVKSDTLLNTLLYYNPIFFNVNGTNLYNNLHTIVDECKIQNVSPEFAPHPVHLT